MLLDLRPETPVVLNYVLQPILQTVLQTVLQRVLAAARGPSLLCLVENKPDLLDLVSEAPIPIFFVIYFSFNLRINFRLIKVDCLTCVYLMLLYSAKLPRIPFEAYTRVPALFTSINIHEITLHLLSIIIIIVIYPFNQSNNNRTTVYK